MRDFRGANARKDTGAVALEFALVLPLFLILVFGVVTAGLAYNDKLSIANAVREGGRMGSTLDYYTAPITPSAWANAVQTRVQQVYLNGASTLPTSDICVKLEDPSGAQLAVPSAQGSNCGTEPSNPPAPPAGSQAGCIVKVWVQKPATIRMAVFPDITVNIGAKSVSYYGRSVGSCPG